ncbi:hypothetical protein ACFVTC_42355 [Streptomyces sp. NPDC057950]|uniref:hypothetical protein n=1 Tax=Streptomyces sp. NPDC057950 TaxID=3346288 RepID=UPI0036F095FD
MPTTLKSAASGYVQDTSYTKLSGIGQVTLGVSSADTAKWLQISNTFEDGTRRLKRELVSWKAVARSISAAGIPCSVNASRCRRMSCRRTRMPSVSISR